MEGITIDLEIRKVPEIMALALKYDKADQETKQHVRDILGITPGYNIIVLEEGNNNGNQ